MPDKRIHTNNSKAFSKDWHKIRECKKENISNKTTQTKRVEMVKKWLSEGHNWDRTLFSDEKRSTLDGSDNWMFYALKGRPVSRQKRICKGGGIMNKLNNE